MSRCCISDEEYVRRQLREEEESGDSMKSLRWDGATLRKARKHTQLIIPMTHAPETGAINRLHFLAPDAGTCVMQNWDRIHLHGARFAVLFKARKWSTRD